MTPGTTPGTTPASEHVDTGDQLPSTTLLGLAVAGSLVAVVLFWLLG